MPAITHETIAKQNARIIERNVRRALRVLAGEDDDDTKCFASFGTDCKGFREHIGGVSPEAYGHRWHFGYHINPRKLRMFSPVQRGTAFCYENMYVISNR